ncbi:MAG TPA: KEOPS complex N(6)-L-threonylcarbamoyladenine synthase Kae1 [Candidatus Acidoferrum sp.]|nr:KEOPS complex N(6)-L-threonylcarbamoyladenine synthase Kae1 [Candidatus Acidoferrum sp.]
MAILGIESTAHTFGVGICSNGKTLANQKSMYPIKDKGMIPIEVAGFHLRNAPSVIENALKEAGVGIKDIDAIGYTKGPGLGPCLEVGQVAAKFISKKYKIPILPVNHAIGHIEVTKQAFGIKDPLVLYVSGGNSQILGLAERPYRHYHVYGETFDIGIGNMLDSFARAAGIVPSWGSQVAKVAMHGRYVELPYTVKGMDFTFTGLLTAATKALQKNSVKNVAYSLQETSFAMLCEAAERALLLTKKRDLILCGGVAQSARLKEMLGIITKSHNTGLYVSPNELNADNGVMIAVVAEKMFNSGERYNGKQLTISQRYRADSVKISW